MLRNQKKEKEMGNFRSLTKVYSKYDDFILISFRLLKIIKFFKEKNVVPLFNYIVIKLIKR